MYEPQGADLVRIIVESFYPVIVVVAGFLLGGVCMLIEKLSYQVEDNVD